MDVSTEKLENNQVVLTITVPQDAVAKAYDKAWRNIAGKLSVPGFRKGKAPRKIVENRVGLPAIREEVFELLVQKSYIEALRQTDIKPVSRPGVDVETLDEDKDMVFKITVTVKPEVQLGQYKGLSAQKVSRAITDADVDSALEKLRERKSSMVVAEGAKLAEGDFAVIDFKGFVDGRPFNGGEGKSYPLEIGSGNFIPGFEEQLVGAGAGEERVIKVTFPADYFTAELAGKEAEFKVTVHDVKRRQTPEVTDEFIKDSSEFFTVEQWRENCRENLEKAALLSARNEYEDNILKAAVDGAVLTIPDAMVEERVSEMIIDTANSLKRRGLKFDDYLKYVGKTLEELREYNKAAAQEDIRIELVMDAIAQAEGIEVSEEELTKEIEQLSVQYKQPVDEVRKSLVKTGNIEQIAAAVLRRKTAKLIIDASVEDTGEKGEVAEDGGAAQ
ncbi:MAG: trigger factor [Acidaminococcales bacterium]|jgi:trigger factor|nr:trigger factor [Acidaminococcales bacterium]